MGTAAIRQAFRVAFSIGYRNPGDVVTRVIWVNTPSTF
jgi:hypothetical protein